MLTAFVMISLSLGAPAEWRCYADLYADGYSCDCGCGIVDPDCRFPEGELQDFAACAGHNCGPGMVPLQGAPGTCAPNVCGDGFAGKGEACDDGDGPGCDDTCQIVADGYRCSGLGAGCGVPVCGDGIVDMDLGERCDDGNDDGSDGCDACVPQPGYMCRLFGGCFPTTCGDGIIDYDWETQTGEACEDGDQLPGDGCDEFCRGEQGWVCTWEGCVEIVCGDGIVARGDFGSGEQCDDANTEPGDGCDGLCYVEPGWFCDDWMGCQQQICGDGVVQPNETCDDANERPGDGCDGCLTEPGWSCRNELGQCVQVVCGDGVIMSDDNGEHFEDCDDSNTEDGDGCDALCHREPGFVCLADGTCRPIVCGDGFVDTTDGIGPHGPKKNPLPIDIPGEPGPGKPPQTSGGDEGCDDGNGVAGDGCSDACQIEDGFVCEVPGELCIFPVCSDGLVQGAETCDDGNDAAGDGCNNACLREAGYVCRVPGQLCEPMPRAWVCSSIIYGSGDGCDCGCGAADPDCATPAALDDCQFNHCLEATPYPTADDPTQCGTTPPPVEVTPEVVEVVEEGGPVEETEAEPQPEVVEAEPTKPTTKDDGCLGGGAVSLLGLAALAMRRRRV